MAAPFGRLVSNMIAGPLTPRDSRLIAVSTRAGERIALEEGAGAEQPRFLAFVEQEGDRPRQRAAPEQRRDFEHRGDADAVVRRARPGRRAVIMGDEEQVLALGRARSSRPDCAPARRRPRGRAARCRRNRR